MLQKIAISATMLRGPRDNPEIRSFILQHVQNHPTDIVALAAERFGVNRVTASRYARKLVDEGLLEASGKTKGTTYALKKLVTHERFIQVTSKLEEHIVWREEVLPYVQDLPESVQDILSYGVSEMVNNVIDHSESKVLVINVERTGIDVEVRISDLGIGIFEKIRRDCGFDDPRHALLELSKGKLTTDPEKHTGEGVFFTSRMFAQFETFSRGLFYSRMMMDGDEWLIETKEEGLKETPGTYVTLRTPLAIKYSSRDVFRRYENEEHSFAKTHVPVRLARYPNEQLVSRSQARRVLARFNQFSEVMLDFDGVPSIGQAFADEIFRVYRLEHPNVTILPVRTSPEVQETIDHVTSRILDQLSLDLPTPDVEPSADGGSSNLE